MSGIRCCYKCVAPKRHPGCHGHCPEYLEEKTEYEARKAVFDKEKATASNIRSQRDNAVRKALKSRRG